MVNETAHLDQIAFENMVIDEKTLHLPDSKCHWQIQAQYFLDHTTIGVKRRLHYGKNRTKLVFLMKNIFCSLKLTSFKRFFDTMSMSLLTKI